MGFKHVTRRDWSMEVSRRFTFARGPAPQVFALPRFALDQFCKGTQIENPGLRTLHVRVCLPILPNVPMKPQKTDRAAADECALVDPWQTGCRRIGKRAPLDIDGGNR